jgi:hypothetical protein
VQQKDRHWFQKQEGVNEARSAEAVEWRHVCGSLSCRQLEQAANGQLPLSHCLGTQAAKGGVLALEL